MRADDRGESTRKIAECKTEAEKAGYELSARRTTTRQRMTGAEIRSIVDRLADIARVLHEADPNDQAEVSVSWASS